MYEFAAFAPAHISGFFGVYDSSPHGSCRGSRGGGVCIDRGAWGRIGVSPGDGRVRVFINGMEDAAPVTKLALSMMAKDHALDVDADIILDLPVGQGFGMSSAGTLASATALKAKLDSLGKKSADPILCTHLAEVVLRTGMGDAVAQALGGIVIREREGVPPHGITRRGEGGDFFVCILGEPIPTDEVLSNEEILFATRDVASRLIPIFSDKLDLNFLMELSRRFAEETGLITPPVREALDALNGRGSGSMVMLGNAVFFSGKQDVADMMSDFGEVKRVSVSRRGACVVDMSDFPGLDIPEDRVGLQTEDELPSDEPQSNEPQSNEPQSNEPQSNEPQSDAGEHNGYSRYQDNNQNESHEDDEDITYVERDDLI